MINGLISHVDSTYLRIECRLIGCQGVELENGHIKVDEFQNTTASGIYALGDVAGKALLTPGNISWLNYT